MKTIAIDENDEKNIRIIIEYLEDSEYKHYLEYDPNERKDHIYTHVVKLKKLLDKAECQETHNQ